MSDQIDLTMCVDCAQINANGVDPNSETEREHALRMFHHTATWTGQIVVGDHTDDFSRVPCGTCGTTLAGARYSGVLFGSMG